MVFGIKPNQTKNQLYINRTKPNHSSYGFNNYKLKYQKTGKTESKPN